MSSLTLTDTGMIGGASKESTKLAIQRIGSFVVFLVHFLSLDIVQYIFPLKIVHEHEQKICLCIE